MPAPSRSAAPFLATLGFALGLGFGYLAFHQERPKVYVAPPMEVKAEPIQRDAGTLASIEVTFERWGGYAVWHEEVTEFAAWDPRLKRHADFYEVRRVDGNFYFRTIPALTRPLIEHGPRTSMPFWFTETQEMKDRFFRENPDYDWSKEPLVDLPPKPPERRARDPRWRPSVTPGAGAALPFERRAGGPAFAPGHSPHHSFLPAIVAFA